MVVGEETVLMGALRVRGIRPCYLPSATIKHFVPDHKATLDHLAVRAQAIGRTGAQEGWLDGRVRRFVLGFPVGHAYRTLLAYGKYARGAIRGRRDPALYLRYRRMKGEVLGLVGRVLTTNAPTIAVTNLPLHLAFVSYEYPPDTSGGGIATSLANTARMHAERGHRVEVFAGSPYRTESASEEGVLVHRVQVGERRELAEAIVSTFGQRHAADPFDLVEGPEYGADARAVHAAFPDLPLVVKLRTSASMITAINNEYVSLASKARFIMGGVRRGQWPKPYWRYDRADDAERTHALSAAGMVAPSEAIRTKAVEFWGADPDQIWVAPHPFEPAPELLSIPPSSGENEVLFLGRLEVRKGVVELAQAARQVIEARPDVRFRFVGASQGHPDTGQDLRELMRCEMGAAAVHAIFHEAVPYERVPDLMAQAAVCAFPSVWESFGFVCLEAMAAARPVVITEATGMAEMVGDGAFGRTVPPRDPSAIAQALLDLLALTDEERARLGEDARRRVLDRYAFGRVAAEQEEVYRQILQRVGVGHV